MESGTARNWSANMNWYKTAKKFTDLQQWILHGVDPQTCRNEFKKRNQIRAKIENDANSKAEELGHVLFKNWSPFLTNRCRKCGMGIKINNVIDKTDAPDITGTAVLNACNVNLGVCDFSDSDKSLMGVNEHNGTTLI